MKNLSSFFKDEHGNLSSIRLFSLIALVIAIILSFKDAEFDIITIWLVAAFAPKAIQKFAEKK